MADLQIPSTDRLVDWLEGKLSSEETAALNQLVAANSELQERVVWLRDFLQISDTTVLSDPPASVREGATAAFAAYIAASTKEKQPPSFLQTLIATLTADNWQRPALAGVRNVSLRDAPRQLIYSSDLADVALNAHMPPNSQQIMLEGQLFPLDGSDPAVYIAQLLQDGVETHLAFCNALGKFSLTELPPGRYELLISREGVEIEISPLELG